jgi:hypothetical protein
MMRETLVTFFLVVTPLAVTLAMFDELFILCSRLNASPWIVVLLAVATVILYIGCLWRSMKRALLKRNHDIIEIAGELRHETEKAFLIFEGDKEVWIPKSHVENNGDGTFSMPEWLAMDKGLI